MAKWIKPSTPRNVKFAKGVNKKINDLLDAKKEMEEKKEDEEQQVQQVNEEQDDGKVEDKEQNE